MAGTSLTMDEKLEALERKFMDMMENMNAAFDKLSREVESNRTGSVPRPPPRHIPPPQNVAPQRVPPDEEEAENEFDDSDNVEERFQPGPNRRPNRRFDRRNDMRDRRFDGRGAFDDRREDYDRKGYGRHGDVDGDLSSIKIKIPNFRGKNDPEAYLEWEKKI